MYILELVWFFTYPLFIAAGMRGGVKGSWKFSPDELAVTSLTFQTFFVIQLCLIVLYICIIPSSGSPEPLGAVDVMGVPGVMVVVTMISLITYFLPLLFSALHAVHRAANGNVARKASIVLALTVWWLLFLALVLLGALKVHARGW